VGLLKTERQLGGLAAWLRSSAAAWIGLGILLVVMAGVLLHEARGTTFWFDEWEFALNRPANELHSYLEPHNEHLSLIPIAIYKLLLATAGMNHYLPYRALVIALHLGCVALLFAYALRRVGGLPALLVATLMVTLGPAWQNFLWPFQIGWLISLAAGLGALMMLDRRDRAGDVTATVLLGLSLASSGLGLPIAIGLAVDVGWGRRRVRDAWIVAAPLSLYVLWWIAYRPASVQRHQFTFLLDFATDSAAAVMNGLTGLTQAPLGGPPATLRWGLPLAVAAVAALIWRLAALRPIPARVLTLLATLLSFWVLTALRRAGFAVGNESRYVYVGAFFTLLLVVELARGAEISRRALPAVLVIVAAIVVANLGDLRTAAGFYRDAAALTRADLGALELGRGIVSSDYIPHGLGYPLVVVHAGAYFRETDRHGSPAATPAEIATSTDVARGVADAELTHIHRVALDPAAPAPPAHGGAPTVDAVSGGTTSVHEGCVTFAPLAVAPPATRRALDLTLPHDGLSITAEDAPLTVALRRFADGFPRDPLARMSAGATATLRIGDDAAAQPWHVRVAPQGRMTACSLPSA
jgi:hypothetical protein